MIITSLTLMMTKGFFLKRINLLLIVIIFINYLHLKWLSSEIVGQTHRMQRDSVRNNHFYWWKRITWFPLTFRQRDLGFFFIPLYNTFIK